MTSWRNPMDDFDEHTDEPRSPWADFWGGALMFIIVLTACTALLDALGALPW